MFLINEFIKNQISNKAEELGFVKIGFACLNDVANGRQAKAEKLDKEGEQLQNWLNHGYDADMKWIKNSFEKRTDLKNIMNNAKTVISLAYNYYTPFAHHENLPKISRYAWGKDYHMILKKKLKELCKYNEDISINGIASSLRSSQLSFKFYVDDGPVMDKVWAKKTGIGWQGKHTNIINPDYGSWIFLCEIITNLDCEIYNQPMEDLCGSCRICINACPTGAIVDEYKLDSNLCISYQTIENKGDIPDYLNLQGWIFGCDICQDVCPFNKNDKPTNDLSFYPKLAIFNKTKEELENITEEQFNEIFEDSPVKRTKYKGWKRNLELIHSREGGNLKH